MELGLWCIETRHKMCALRLLRDIVIGDPSSQLREIYNTYLLCFLAPEWPTGSWCAWVREILTPLDMDRLHYEWDSPLAARDIAQLHETTYWQYSHSSLHRQSASLLCTRIMRV